MEFFTSHILVLHNVWQNQRQLNNNRIKKSSSRALNPRLAQPNMREKSNMIVLSSSFYIWNSNNNLFEKFPPRVEWVFAIIMKQSVLLNTIYRHITFWHAMFLHVCNYNLIIIRILLINIFQPFCSLATKSCIQT